MLYALCFIISQAINEEVHSLLVEHTCDITAPCNLLTAHKVFISSALLHWPRRFCNRWDRHQHQPPARLRKLSCAFHSLCMPALAFVIVAQTVGWCLALPELFSKSWSVVSLRWRAVVDAQCRVSERWRICSVQCGCKVQCAWMREKLQLVWNCQLCCCFGCGHYPAFTRQIGSYTGRFVPTSGYLNALWFVLKETATCTVGTCLTAWNFAVIGSPAKHYVVSVSLLYVVASVFPLPAEARFIMLLCCWCCF